MSETVVKLRDRFSELSAEVEAFEERVFDAAYERIYEGMETKPLKPNARRVARRFKIKPDEVERILAERGDEIDRREEEEKEERQAERRERCGPAPEKDGRKVVFRYLYPRMNDPSSLEIQGCNLLWIEDGCYVAKCTYRGTNAFGATVVNSAEFYISQGKVTKKE